MAHNQSLETGVTELITLLRNNIEVGQEISDMLKGIQRKAQKRRWICLGTKTIGSTVSAAGTGVTAAGIYLAPATFGMAAIVLTIPGFALTMTGSAVTVGTAITNTWIRKSDLYRLYELGQKFNERHKHWEERLNEFPEIRERLNSEMSNGSSDENANAQIEEQTNYLALWLKIGNLYSDEEIRITEIREGDHLFRPTRVKIGFHHGVYMGQNPVSGVNEIVDFGNDNHNVPVFQTLESFLGPATTVHRRNYHEYGVSVQETLDLARSVTAANNWTHYHLIVNNCEHFATFLKLKVRWSSQTCRAFENIATMVKLPPQLLKPGYDVGSSVANTLYWRSIFGVSNPSTFLGSISEWLGGTALLSKLPKFSLVLAPVSILVDLGILIADFRKKQPDIKDLGTAIAYTDCILTMYNIYLERLMTCRTEKTLK